MKLRSVAAVAHRRWPETLILLAPACLFSEYLFTGRVVFWGLPLLQFYPWRWLAAQQIWEGRLPLWNPYLGNGAPLLANYQSAVFYPPNWIGLLPGVPLDYSLGLVGVLHLAWAGLGMAAFGRALGLSTLGRAIAGLAFSLSGYLVARFSFLTIVAAAAWLPWLLWTVERMAQASDPSQAQANTGLGRLSNWIWPLPNVPWLVPLSLMMAMQLLAGHAQTTFYSFGIAGGWYAWRGYQCGRISGAVRHGLGFGVAAALAACLTAIQLLPTAELLRQSSRADAAAYDFVMTYSFWPWRLITLFAPDAFGNPGHGNYWGYGNYWEDAAYVGLLPLGLAALAVIVWLVALRRPPEPSAPVDHDAPPSHLPAQPGLAPHPLSHVPVLGLAAVISLLLALGQNTPIFPFLYHYVPTFNLFQAPARIMLGWITAIAVLAGIGADLWQQPQGAGRAWIRRGLTAALGVALAGGLAAPVMSRALAVGPASAHLVLQTAPRAVALAGLLAAGAFGLWLIRPAAHAAGWWTLLAAGFVAADLGLAARALNPALDASIYRTPAASSQLLDLRLAGRRYYQFEADEHALIYDRFFRFDDFGPARLPFWQAARAAMLPNLSLLDGIATSNNFDPLLPARYTELAQALQAASPAQALAIFRAMNVQALIAVEPPPGLEAIYQGDGFGIYALREPARRIRIAYYLRAANSPRDAFEVVTSPGFDPDALAVIENANLAATADRTSPVCRSALFDSISRRAYDERLGWLRIPGSSICQYYTDSAVRTLNRSLSAVAEAAGRPDLAISGPDPADVLGPFEALGEVPVDTPVLLTDTSTHIRIAAPMQFAGYVVLSDTFYPGWKAYVDGRPAHLVAANYAFRAVYVSAGRHIVEFRYQPDSVALGGALSGLAWLGLGAFWLWDHARRQPARERPAA
jgi:hypothetical protein